MTAEILVNVTPRESRGAFLENGVLHEVYIERANRRGITSNIYKGRVSRVLPGMQAAFIDVGLDRTAFLHVSDIARREDVDAEFEAPPTDAAAVARGASLFVSATCASCHAGTLGTNNTTVDVGTGGAFQVPRLVELGWRHQWFHDGRIATAAQRFDPNAGGDQHGHVSNLTPRQQADLIEYLRSR